MADESGRSLPTNQPLRSALDDFVHSGGSAERQRAVHDALLSSVLIFPAVNQPSARLALAYIKDARGEVLTPAFTDSGALLKWAPSGHSVATADARGFIPAVLAGPCQGMVLNPGSKASIVLDRKALEYLAQRLAARK